MYIMLFAMGHEWDFQCVQCDPMGHPLGKALAPWDVPRDLMGNLMG